MNNIDIRIEELVETLENNTKKYVGYINECSKKIDNLEKRIDDLDKNLSFLNEKMKNSSDKYVSIENDLNECNFKLTQIKTAIGAVTTPLTTTILGLHAKIGDKVLEGQVVVLKSNEIKKVLVTKQNKFSCLIGKELNSTTIIDNIEYQIVDMYFK